VEAHASSVEISGPVCNLINSSVIAHFFRSLHGLLNLVSNVVEAQISVAVFGYFCTGARRLVVLTEFRIGSHFPSKLHLCPSHRVYRI
jgi:hypothetical protein